MTTFATVPVIGSDNEPIAGAHAVAVTLSWEGPVDPDDPDGRRCGWDVGAPSADLEGRNLQVCFQSYDASGTGVYSEREAVGIRLTSEVRPPERARESAPFPLVARCHESDRINRERDCEFIPDPEGVETGAGGTYACPEIETRSSVCWVERLDLVAGVAALRCEQDLNGVTHQAVVERSLEFGGLEFGCWLDAMEEELEVRQIP